MQNSPSYKDKDEVNLTTNAKIQKTAPENDKEGADRVHTPNILNEANRQRDSRGPGAMRGSMGLQPLGGAYRFSFASKDDEFTFLNKPAVAVNPASTAAAHPMNANNYALTRDSVDILQTMGQPQRFKHKSPHPTSSNRPDANEYALKDYRNRAASPAHMQAEMQMRPTVMPVELREVKKHETV